MDESMSRWRERAACCGVDPELFFPLIETGPAKLQVQEAKQICAPCPVQAMCLSWAFQHGMTDGVWGGRTEKERRTMLHEQWAVPEQRTPPAAQEWPERRGQHPARDTA